MKARIALLVLALLPGVALGQAVDLAVYGNDAPVAEVNTIAGIRAKLAESCKKNAECMTYFSVDGSEVKQIKPRPPTPVLSTAEMKAKLAKTLPPSPKP